MQIRLFIGILFLLLTACSDNIIENKQVSKSTIVENANPSTKKQKKELAARLSSSPKKQSQRKPPIQVPKKSKKAAPKSQKKRKIIQKEPAPFVDIEDQNPLYIPNKIPEADYPTIFGNNPQFIADGFDYPVGKPDAVGYYKSQNFGDRLHLGEDWNGKGGGDTDFGDPVYATAHGLVTFVEDVCCGWGNTIRVVHYLPNQPDQPFVESLYSHLHTMQVGVGDLIQRGQQIGTIGNAQGRYVAHLHFEMRDFINMSIGPGYSDDQQGYLDPTPFIKAHRP